MARKRKPSETPTPRALMEELEPRLLFSADLPGVLAQSGLFGADSGPAPPAITALVDAPSAGFVIGGGLDLTDTASRQDRSDQPEYCLRRPHAYS